MSAFAHASYDAIAREYQQSKQLPFRIHVEAYTLTKLLGDVRSLSVLDLACGEGIYSRVLRRAGAARVVGVDLSSAMIALARAEEERAPLGCEYMVGDAAQFEPPGTFDVVLGSYLLNYAESPQTLRRFASTIFASLKPGGRFVGINDNPAQDPSRYASCEPYGFKKTSSPGRAEGDAITYSFRSADGGTFQFDNYYLHPATIAGVFSDVGFSRFAWEGPWLAPGAETGFAAGYWTEFLADPPVIGVVAERMR
jgi:SAM-dependent methyltransferase